MIGLPGFLGDRAVLGFGNNAAVGWISIRVKRRVLAIDRRKLVPQLPCALSAAIANMESKDLTALDIQGQPQPLRVRLFADKAPEFVCFSLQRKDKERIGVLSELDIE